MSAWYGYIVRERDKVTGRKKKMTVYTTRQDYIDQVITPAT